MSRAVRRNSILMGLMVCACLAGPVTAPAVTADGQSLPLRQGDSGDAVADVRRRLQSLGFHSSLDADGIFGVGTRAAVEAEGSDGGHVYVAVRKALVALTFKMPSSQASMAVQTDKALLAQVTPNMFVMEGAVPLMAGSEIIGAIGASGAAGGDQDEVCAIAGLNKIKTRLK